MPNRGKLAKTVVVITEYYEHVVVIALLFMLMAVILIATFALLSLVVATVEDRIRETDILHTTFTLPLLHDVFTGFLMILIGLELIKTVVMYLDKQVVHVEVVLTVALIAVARHVIDMDLNTAEPLNLVGTGVVVSSLSLGYFYFKKAKSFEREPDAESETGVSREHGHTALLIPPRRDSE